MGILGHQIQTMQSCANQYFLKLRIKTLVVFFFKEIEGKLPIWPRFKGLIYMHWLFAIFGFQSSFIQGWYGSLPGINQLYLGTPTTVLSSNFDTIHIPLLTLSL